MHKEFWVLHYGAGTDGGFGDWSPPFWSDNPLELGGEVVWFATKDEAEEAADKLSKKSSDVFYAHGEHDTYDGEFPIEYEARRMFTPTSKQASVSTAVARAEAELFEFWKLCEWEYEEDE